jgi:hypothetical protein
MKDDIPVQQGLLNRSFSNHGFQVSAIFHLYNVLPTVRVGFVNPRLLSCVLTGKPIASAKCLVEEKLCRYPKSDF